MLLPAAKNPNRHLGERFPACQATPAAGVVRQLQNNGQSTGRSSPLSVDAVRISCARSPLVAKHCGFWGFGTVVFVPIPSGLQDTNWSGNPIRSLQVDYLWGCA